MKLLPTRTKAALDKAPAGIRTTPFGRSPIAPRLAQHASPVCWLSVLASRPVLRSPTQQLPASIRAGHAPGAGIVLGVLLAVLAGCGGGGDGAAPAPSGPATLSRTLAYVNNRCREDANGFSLDPQTLRVRRGEGDEVVVKQLPSAGPFAPDNSCQIVGRTRFGFLFLVAGGFQRLAVSPDGATVAFEVTDDFAIDRPTPLLADEEGIFIVGADGRNLRRLAAASRNPTYRAFLVDDSPFLILLPDIKFSPNGRLLAYSDIGPGPDGDTVQIFTLDVQSGERRQVTHLSLPPLPSDPPSCCPNFIDDRTITFPTTTNIDGQNPDGKVAIALVNTDGSGLRLYPEQSFGTGQVVPQFSITSTSRSPVLLSYDLPDNDFYREVFLLQGEHQLQLTNFQLPDTSDPTLSADGLRVMFVASADPKATNSTANCQLFSIDVTGGDLQQVTNFSEAPQSQNGCIFTEPPGCAVNIVGQDAGTGSVVLYSNCDPLQQNQFGAQLFTMRPDGSGLRQLTQASGLIVHDNGEISTEIPAPFAFATR